MTQLYTRLYVSCFPTGIHSIASGTHARYSTDSVVRTSRIILVKINRDATNNSSQICTLQYQNYPSISFIHNFLSFVSLTIGHWNGFVPRLIPSFPTNCTGGEEPRNKATCNERAGKSCPGKQDLYEQILYYDLSYQNHLIRDLAMCSVIGRLSDQSSGFGMLQELVHDASTIRQYQGSSLQKLDGRPGKLWG